MTTTNPLPPLNIHSFICVTKVSVWFLRLITVDLTYGICTSVVAYTMHPTRQAAEAERERIGEQDEWVKGRWHLKEGAKPYQQLDIVFREMTENDFYEHARAIAA